MVLSDRRYDQWRVEERVSLILQASARGDRCELNRLYASAPRRALRGPEPRFLKAIHAVLAINSWIVIELSRRLGILTGVGMASIAADAVVRDEIRHRAAAQLDLLNMLGASVLKKPLRKVKPILPEDEKPLEMNDLMSPSLTTVVTEIVSFRSALDKFARQKLGVTADQLLDATHPDLNAQLQATVFSQISPSDGMEATVSAKLREIWANVLA